MSVGLIVGSGLLDWDVGWAPTADRETEYGPRSASAPAERRAASSSRSRTLSRPLTANKSWSAGGSWPCRATASRTVLRRTP